jgi:hypothetical protein
MMQSVVMRQVAFYAAIARRARITEWLGRHAFFVVHAILDRTGDYNRQALSANTDRSRNLRMRTRPAIAAAEAKLARGERVPELELGGQPRFHSRASSNIRDPHRNE